MSIDQKILAMFSGIELPPCSSVPIHELRKQVRDSSLAIPQPNVTLQKVEDKKIPGPGGDIPARFYTPLGNEPFPLVVFFHSGGWVMGDLDTEDGIARVIAAETGAVVVSVEYRLAPEHTFPAPNDDAYAATKWVAEHAAEIGGVASKLAVLGLSTGGVLATGVALRVRDEGGPRLAGFANFYGSCNYPSEQTASAREFSDGIVLKNEDVTFFYNTYLGDPEKYQADPQASPIRAKSLAGLAPGFIGTAECDPSRDDAEAFARKLKEAGGNVTLKRYPGMIHGFLSWSTFLPEAQEGIRDVSSWLKQRFATSK
jgi:acetyl esterase